MTNIKLYCGDCLQIMDSLTVKGVDCVICDLPYGVTARNKWDVSLDLPKLWRQYEKIVKENGAIILFAQGMFTAKLMLSNSALWRYNLIWQKTQPTGFLNAKKMPLRAHEDICVFYKKPPLYNPQMTSNHVRKISSADSKKTCKNSYNYNPHTHFTTYDSTERYPRSIITFPKDTQKSALHPTQKPTGLCEYLIRTYTNEGDTVLDNCMGSGSTGVACALTKRNFIGIKKDPHYFQIAKERIEGIE